MNVSCAGARLHGNKVRLNTNGGSLYRVTNLGPDRHGSDVVVITRESCGYCEEHFRNRGFNKVGKTCNRCKNDAMHPQELATLTAFALGFITCGPVLTAGVSLIGTAYTIAPREIKKLKTRALKAMVIAGFTGAGAVVIFTSF